ncbi:MAG: SPFH domain-containing protein [Cyanobacteria bacterium]|nr:SPFH domain-containing protein [Cyanobacteriota bacterium]
MEPITVSLILLALAGSTTTLVIKNLYYICQPSEILIFAGTRSTLSDGGSVGYRLVKGGSSIRLPILEETFRMELTNMIIELRVSNAYSKGGIPLTVEGVANIKIAGEEPIIHNAIERLLGKSRKEIEQLAKETLEGNLRGILASLTPEQVNEDKVKFARSLSEEAEHDLNRLGLVLDNLQIKNISDEVRYLDSIGRKQQADLFRDARIAEAKTRSESSIQASENDRATALRRIERDLEIAKASADRRVRDALTKRSAVIAEVESVVASQVARVRAEVAVQTERIKQVEQQLQADVVAPAEAGCQKSIALAKAEAAQIIESGKAQANGIRSLSQSWNSAGGNARQIFVLQKLEPLLKTLSASVPEVTVKSLTVVDPQEGGMATKVAGFLEQLKQTTGIDAVNAIDRLGRGD